MTSASNQESGAQMPRPFFAVLIPAYQAASTLPQTLESLLHQSFLDWEAVIVDDGSTDATFEVAERIADTDARLKVVRQENAGAGPARNRAARDTRAPWLVALDADDLFEPNALAQHAAFIVAHPGFDLYSCGAYLLSPDGTKEPWRFGIDTGGQPTSFTLQQMIRGNRLLQSTVVSRQVFERLSGFRAHYLEDYDFWLRAFAAGARHLHNPELLYTYRLSAHSKNTARERAAIDASDILVELAETPGLSTKMRREALEQAEYCRASVVRWRLESRLRDGNRRSARRDYLSARRAYPNGLKWGLGLGVVMMNPLWLSRLRPGVEPPAVNLEHYDGIGE